MRNLVRRGRYWLRTDAPDAVLDIIVIIIGSAILSVAAGILWSVLKGLF